MDDQELKSRSGAKFVLQSIVIVFPTIKIFSYFALGYVMKILSIVVYLKNYFLALIKLE